MRVAAVAAVLVLSASGCTPLDSAAAGGGGPVVSVRLRAAVGQLPVSVEHRGGYARSKFEHWVDADRDGCNTRNEVLIAEAVRNPHVSGRCRLAGGRWLSWYDRRSWTDRSRLDVDHMVPLAEAWDSGASGWTAARRRGYANDLGDLRALVAVTDSVNQAKSDQDPAEWLPRYDRCRYVAEWTAVKLRWRLSVDGVERSALRRLVGGCVNVLVRVKRV
jgi:hypothetical protein